MLGTQRNIKEIRRKVATDGALLVRKQTYNINHVANKINYEIATRKLFITQTDNPKNIPPI